jgi:hypothetical protein
VAQPNFPHGGLGWGKVEGLGGGTEASLACGKGSRLQVCGVSGSNPVSSQSGYDHGKGKLNKIYGIEPEWHDEWF